MQFATYFDNWVKLYKKGKVSEVTLRKYDNSKLHLIEFGLDIEMSDLNRISYQKAINHLGEHHASRTVGTFHKHFKAALEDAVENEVISKNPANKAVIGGKSGRQTRKFLNYAEWKQLIDVLDVTKLEDMMIYLAATTGMRYGEIVGLTVKDVDWAQNTISINKTWDYKYGGGFKTTKNKASVRSIAVDKMTMINLRNFSSHNSIENPAELLFWSNQGRILHSSEINGALTRILNNQKIPRVTFHGLRHPHASVLLYGGMTVLSVARRLGHSSTSTTQQIYLHLVKELEAKDNSKLQRLFDNL